MINLANFRTSQTSVILARILADPRAIGCPVNPSPFLFPRLFVLFLYINAFRACRPKRPVTFHKRSSFAWRRGLSFALHGGGLSRSEKSISLWERFQLRIKIGRRPFCYNEEKRRKEKRNIYRLCQYIMVVEFENNLKIEHWLLLLKKSPTSTTSI